MYLLIYVRLTDILKITYLLTSLLCRLGEFISDEYQLPDDDDVTGLSSAAQCQYFACCQRTPSTVLIESSGECVSHLCIYYRYGIGARR